MRLPIWRPGLTPEQERDIAYQERNLLAMSWSDGWYVDKDAPSGFSRVLSAAEGSLTFHIPDDFEVGRLQQIIPNWDGGTTEQKWRKFFEFYGITVDETQ